MFPVLEGLIARRVLLNFRADPEVVARQLPHPFEPVVRNGFAVVGVCLIRLEGLRPRGFSLAVGINAENMAHRVAVRWPTAEGPGEGVFVWRRETDLRLISALGGRVFPGVHQPARFFVRDRGGEIAMDVATRGNEADVDFEAAGPAAWRPTPAFRSFEEVSDFFRRGAQGFSCGLDRRRIEGLRLETLKWEIAPLAVRSARAAFFESADRFPRGSLEFDNGLIMRGIPHEWHPV